MMKVAHSEYINIQLLQLPFLCDMYMYLIFTFYLIYILNTNNYLDYFVYLKVYKPVYDALM